MNHLNTFNIPKNKDVNELVDGAQQKKLQKMPWN